MISTSNVPQSHKRRGSLLQVMIAETRRVRRRSYSVDSQGIDDNSVLLSAIVEGASPRASEQTQTPLDVFGIHIPQELNASQTSLAVEVPMLPMIDTAGDFEWFGHFEGESLGKASHHEQTPTLSSSSFSVSTPMENDSRIGEAETPQAGNTSYGRSIQSFDEITSEDIVAEIGGSSIFIDGVTSSGIETRDGFVHSFDQMSNCSLPRNTHVPKVPNVTEIPSIAIIEATPRPQFDSGFQATQLPLSFGLPRSTYSHMGRPAIPSNGHISGHVLPAGVSAVNGCRTFMSQSPYYDRASAAHPDVDQSIYIGPDEHSSSSSRLSFILRAIGTRIRASIPN
ncbi:hypothetical protein FRC17_009813 [Serendipita sp. 399]|nr:hypothetical protein FRC17_009813 [Serendipita sp. 399]